MAEWLTREIRIFLSNYLFHFVGAGSNPAGVDLFCFLLFVCFSSLHPTTTISSPLFIFASRHFFSGITKIYIASTLLCSIGHCDNVLSNIDTFIVIVTRISTNENQIKSNPIPNSHLTSHSTQLLLYFFF